MTADGTTGKKIKGRKRFLIVDTQGNLLGILVRSADLHEVEGGEYLINTFIRSWQEIIKIWADQGYQGNLVKRMQERHGITVEIVEKLPDQEGFVVLPRRWVVERTIAWLNRYRRLSKDYEYLPECSESMIYLASIDLMLKRLHGRETEIKQHRARHERRYLDLAA